MRGVRLLILIALVFSANSGLVAGLAQAQAIIRAQFAISMTDPGSGSVFRVNRLSSRTWSNMAACQRDTEGLARSHATAVAEWGVINSTGQALAVKVETIDCFVVREQ